MGAPAFHLLDARGNVSHFLRSPGGQTVTNIAVTTDGGSVVMTGSATECLLRAPLPAP
ncbi:hypothetical protein ACSLUB_10455 [Bordetella hinzii]|uniref:hypothetical protein n=1 Tax=Bordetella hinzii TaxID=103855 RepID=UPI003F1CC9BC